MMSNTFGAPLGGTTRGGHHCLESRALSLITPPNFIGGGGICFPSIVTVALGEPGVPVTFCAILETEEAARAIAIAVVIKTCLSILICSSVICLLFGRALSIAARAALSSRRFRSGPGHNRC